MEVECAEEVLGGNEWAEHVLRKLEHKELLTRDRVKLSRIERALEGAVELRYAHVKELKRQLRVLKNRESAHASRIRKKAEEKAQRDQLQTLREENDRLSDEVLQLQKRVVELESEVQQLRHSHATQSSCEAPCFVPDCPFTCTNGPELDWWIHDCGRHDEEKVCAERCGEHNGELCLLPASVSHAEHVHLCQEDSGDRRHTHSTHCLPGSMHRIASSLPESKMPLL